MLDKKIGYFMAVVEAGSFSAAAKKLFISQPTLSQQISTLEEEIGVTLFDRTGYRPVLTVRGHAFYDGCVDMRQLEDETLKRINSIGEATIRVGFNGASANRPLINAIKAVAAQMPGVEFIFKKGNPEELVAFLQNDKIDLSFGLESDYRHTQGISYDAILNYEMKLICAADHPLAKCDKVSLTEIADKPFEFLSASFGKNYFKEFKESYKADGVKLNIVKYADNYDELVFDLIMGNVVTISSEFVMKDPELKAIPIVETHHTNRYVVAWNEKKGNKDYLEFLSSLTKIFRTL